MTLFYSFFIGVLVFSSVWFGSPVYSAEIRDLTFPVDGPYQPFSDSFGDPRSGGRTHGATDIIADKHTPLVSVVDGRVKKVIIPEASWGYAIYLEDDDGYEYAYLHVNNDTPGTDDGNGGTEHAYAPGIVKGARVTRGQLVGWVGDSGNAEWVTDHLHFEMYDPSGNRVNPYQSLLAAAATEQSIGSFSPEAEQALAPTINDDKSLYDEDDSHPCQSGDLIKSPEFTAVYYCGADGKRYVFPTDKVYFSWYDDFSSVTTITAAELAAVPIGGNVTYRPGTRLVKVTTDSRVYAVARGGMLRWVKNPDIAESLYGANWSKTVDDIPDAFFTNYTIGEDITFASP